MRRNKYNAKKTLVDGIVFDSRAEAKYYADLKAMENAKVISGLIVHPKYPIVYQGDKVCIVELDFEYNDVDGAPHFVDVKGVYTAMSRLKHKLFKAFYGSHVEIVRVGKR
jgi:hypothetical protein